MYEGKKEIIDAWKNDSPIVFIDQNGKLVTDNISMYVVVDPTTGVAKSKNVDYGIIPPERQIINDFHLIYRVALASGEGVQRYLESTGTWRDLIYTSKDRKFSSSILYRIRKVIY